MHLCKVCLVKKLKMISRKILENGGKFVNLPHCETIDSSKLISRKISAFLVPAFMKAKAKVAKGKNL